MQLRGVKTQRLPQPDARQVLRRLEAQDVFGRQGLEAGRVRTYCLDKVFSFLNQ